MTVTVHEDTAVTTISYTITDSPLGRLLVAATGRGICAVRLGDEDAPLESELRREHPGVALAWADAALSPWTEAVLAYLGDRRTELDLPLDVTATPFQRRAWNVLRAIPYGATRSYADVARALGAPAAARAVARACAANPAALVIPCHRVVRSDGDPGGYRWGVARKAALLERERAVVLGRERHVLRALVASLPPAEAAAVPSRTEIPFQPGDVVAERYELKALLGAGGTGAVYRAHDRELDETVALKVLTRAPPHRFREEIRLARRVSDPHVVRTHDLGEADGRRFITMEYVDGVALADLVRRLGRLPVPATLVIGLQLARALASAHAQGVLHRDVKPQNVLLTRQGDVKLADFGIAALLDGRPGPRDEDAGAGTLWYTAPEQLLGEELDERADLYALGALLYECLTGRPPFTEITPRAQLARTLEHRPVPLHELNPEVPPALSRLVLVALAPHREDRPGTATGLHDALAGLEASPRHLVAENELAR